MGLSFFDIFEDRGVKTALARYISVVKGREKAKFLLLGGRLKQKAEEAERTVQKCGFCEWNCRVNRKEGVLGRCRVGYVPRVSSVFSHWGEEAELIPSGTIFFTGCNFECQYCQNWELSQFPESGSPFTPRDISDWMEHCDCINVNFVGGEPTPNLHTILEGLLLCKKNIPVVWNSNMYMSREGMRLLEGAVDVYLADFRYGNDACAKKYSHAERYMEVIPRNLKLAKKDAEIIIRVLVIPNHIECCTKPILSWISENFGYGVRVNLMSQYAPHYNASSLPEIDRPLTREEYNEALDYAKALELNLESQGFHKSR